MFIAFPQYAPFRTLALQAPMLQGEDVFALQTALSECGVLFGARDGILGPQTERGIKQAQAEFNLEVDGKAGGLTQRALALDLAENEAALSRVPFNALKGQLELESGYRLGIYSPQRPNGSYDAGVTQRNTQFTKPELGFDPKLSIAALAVQVRKHFDLFLGLSPRRRWALAQGSWNAPAFACYIAREEGAKAVTQGMTARPSAEARTIFEAYVTHASVYLTI